MVEQAAVNRKVEGSSPSLGAIFLKKPKGARTREGVTQKRAGMAELADAQDLKSCDPYRSYRFDPGFRHHLFLRYAREHSASGAYKQFDIAG